MKDWDADLRDIKVGDIIATIHDGWIKVTKIDDKADFSVCTSERTYTLDGFWAETDKAPSAFEVPPAWLLEIIGPKPDMCPLCRKCMPPVHVIDDVAMCGECSEMVLKFKAAKEDNKADTAESEVTGHDDNGVPLHDGDEVLARQRRDHDPIRRCYRRQKKDKMHLCYIGACDKRGLGGITVEWNYVEKVKDTDD